MAKETNIDWDVKEPEEPDLYLNQEAVSDLWEAVHTGKPVVNKKVFRLMGILGSGSFTMKDFKKSSKSWSAESKANLSKLLSPPNLDDYPMLLNLLTVNSEGLPKFTSVELANIQLVQWLYLANTASIYSTIKVADYVAPFSKQKQQFIHQFVIDKISKLNTNIEQDLSEYHSKLARKKALVASACAIIGGAVGLAVYHLTGSEFFSGFSSITFGLLLNGKVNSIVKPELPSMLEKMDEWEATVLNPRKLQRLTSTSRIFDFDNVRRFFCALYKSDPSTAIMCQSLLAHDFICLQDLSHLASKLDKMGLSVEDDPVLTEMYQSHEALNALLANDLNVPEAFGKKLEALSVPIPANTGDL